MQFYCTVFEAAEIHGGNGVDMFHAEYKEHPYRLRFRIGTTPVNDPYIYDVRNIIFETFLPKNWTV